MRLTSRGRRLLRCTAALAAAGAAGVLAAHPLAAVAVIGAAWAVAVTCTIGRHVRGGRSRYSIDQEEGSWSQPSHVHLVPMRDRSIGL